LFQEYYAAEALLGMFADRHPDVVEPERFQHLYLNYLKWTECVAIVLSLMEDKEKVVAVVKQALDVDLMLGARLAGEVRSNFQYKMVFLVNELEIPDWLKIKLFGDVKLPQAIEFLNKFIQNKDGNLLEFIVDSLGKINSISSIEELLYFANSSSSDIQEKSLQSLSRIVSFSPLCSLLHFLERPDPYVVIIAIELLKRSKSVEVMDFLGEITKNSSPKIRKNAAELLGQASTDRVIQPLLNLLNDNDSSVVGSAVFSLAKILEQSDSCRSVEIKILIDLFSFQDKNIRWSVANALGKVAEVYPDFIISELLKNLETVDPILLEESLFTLGIIRTPFVIDKAYGLKESNEIDVLVRLAFALGRTRLDEAINSLVNLIEKNERKIVIGVANALGEIGSERAVQELVGLVEKTDDVVLITIIKALGRTKFSRSVQSLKFLASNSNNIIRNSAVAALGNIHSHESLEVLLDLLELTEDWNTICEIINSLGNFTSTLTVDPLTQVLSSPNRYLCLASLNALGKIGSRETFFSVVEMLKSCDTEILLAAINSLGKFASDAESIHLFSFLDHSRQSVRLATINSLGKICSKQAVSKLVEVMDISESKMNLRSCTTQNLIDIPFFVEPSSNELNKLFTWYEGFSANSNYERISSSCLIMTVRGHVDQGDGIDSAPLMTFPVEEDSFEAECKIYFSSKINYQRAGFGVCSSIDRRNYLRIQKIESNRIEVSVREGSYVKSLKVHSYDGDSVKFKIQKLGDVFKVFYSHDDHTWLSACDPQELDFLGEEIFINLSSSHNDLRASAKFEDFRIRQNVDAFHLGKRASIALGNIAKRYPDSVAPYLSHLHNYLLNDFGQESANAIQLVQSNCKFYNYEIFHSPPAKPHPTQQEILDIIATTVVETNERIKQMADQPSRTINMHGSGNYIEKVEDGYHEHRHAQEASTEADFLTIVQIIQALEQKHDQVNNQQQAIEIIDAEFKVLQASQSPQWQNLLSVKRLYNGGKKAAVKVGEHFTQENPWGKGFVAFLEGFSEDVK
jgi:HEAT repeat protein